MVETFTVEQRGVGKPDYTREISLGRERAGIYLKYNQALWTFALLATDLVPHPYPVAWVKDRIAFGGTSRFYNVSTGAITPLTIPQGYTMTIVQIAMGADQDFEVALYFEVDPVDYPGTLLLVHVPATPMSAGQGIYRNIVVPYSSATFDPTGASAHLVDAIIYNLGGGALKGAFTINALIEAVGTSSLPTTKDCQCPFCSHIQTVKVGTTTIKCGKCGETYFVQDFSNVREL